MTNSTRPGAPGSAAGRSIKLPLRLAVAAFAVACGGVIATTFGPAAAADDPPTPTFSVSPSWVRGGTSVTVSGSCANGYKVVAAFASASGTTHYLNGATSWSFSIDVPRYEDRHGNELGASERAVNARCELNDGGIVYYAQRFVTVGKSTDSPPSSSEPSSSSSSQPPQESSTTLPEEESTTTVAEPTTTEAATTVPAETTTVPATVAPPTSAQPTLPPTPYPTAPPRRPSTSTPATTTAPTPTTAPTSTSAPVLDWRPGDDGPVEAPSDAVRPGDEIEVTVQAFVPGERVDGTQYSTPRPLGRRQADANGAVTFAWTIRDDETSGWHRLVLDGETTGTVVVRFEVVGGALPATR